MLGASFFRTKVSQGESRFCEARWHSRAPGKDHYPVLKSPHSPSACLISRHAVDAHEWAPKAEPATSESFETEILPPAVAGSPEGAALVLLRHRCFRFSLPIR